MHTPLMCAYTDYDCKHRSRMATFKNVFQIHGDAFMVMHLIICIGGSRVWQGGGKGGGGGKLSHPLVYHATV